MKNLANTHMFLKFQELEKLDELTERLREINAFFNSITEKKKKRKIE